MKTNSPLSWHVRSSQGPNKASGALRYMPLRLATRPQITARSAWAISFPRSPSSLSSSPSENSPLSLSTLSWKNRQNPGPRVPDFPCKRSSGGSWCCSLYLLLLISHGPRKHILEKRVATVRVLHSTKITSFLWQRLSVSENRPIWELLGAWGTLSLGLSLFIQISNYHLNAVKWSLN